MLRYETLADVSADALQRFDLIIDARSPGEYAEDHLPGAVNLPVMDNAERAEIGTTYVQESPFKARRAGAAVVARNVARHLETTLANRPKGFRPLVYCWRGGMRSNAFAIILAAVGWPVAVLEGGYQTWRKAVRAGIEATAPQLRPVLIDGQTGTAKTALLHRLHAKGAQVIDLEGLAQHRGSAFGDFADAPQPSQKGFETGLWSALCGLDPARPVFVEAESARIGSVRIPAPLWTQMKAAPRIEITAPVAERARFLAQAYADIAGDPDRIQAALDRLAPFHPRAQIADWRDLAEAGDPAALAQALMAGHYDPAYDRARRKRPSPPAITLATPALDTDALEALADQVIAAATSL